MCVFWLGFQGMVVFESHVQQPHMSLAVKQNTITVHVSLSQYQ